MKGLEIGKQAQELVDIVAIEIFQYIIPHWSHKQHCIVYLAFVLKP